MTTPRSIELQIQMLRDELVAEYGHAEFVDELIAIIHPGPRCPECRGPLNDPHDDPQWDAVCCDCCIECRDWTPGECYDVPRHGPGVIISVDKMGGCRFLVRDLGAGPLTFVQCFPRGFRPCPRPDWAVELGGLLVADRSLFGQVA